MNSCCCERSVMKISLSRDGAAGRCFNVDLSWIGAPQISGSSYRFPPPSIFRPFPIPYRSLSLSPKRFQRRTPGRMKGKSRMECRGAGIEWPMRLQKTISMKSCSSSARARASLDVQFVDGHSVEEVAHGRAGCTSVISPPFTAMSANRPSVCGCCSIPIRRSGKEVDKSAKCRFSA
jgi:hypothetical protein